MKPATFRIRLFAAAIFVLGPFISQAQQPLRFPYSDLADKGCRPCVDTVKVLFVKKTFDIGRLLPEWKPVLHPDSLSVCEGTVVPSNPAYSSCHISPLDFSGYHFTHDLSFDMVPDEGYRHLLAQRIYPQEDGSVDTVMQTTLHCEWESGIGNGGKEHPFGEAMRQGNSAGFLTAGHTRRERLWTLPTIGDWLHIEGLWIWDRGHPPARTEIHPIRFMGIVRNLPDWIATSAGDSVFATRTDLFASGNGGALMNNLPGQAPFVRKTRMSGKTYSFVIKPRLPRPGPGTSLKWRMSTQPGDDFKGTVSLEPVTDGLKVQVDWTDQPDDAVLGRSIHCWWDAPLGKHPQTQVHTYEVSLKEIRIKLRKEGITRSEWRFFTDVGGQWFFLNEFLPVDDILNDGLAKSFTRKWPVNQKLRVHVPEGIAFRIFAGGWEADGMDEAFGKVLNPEAACTQETKKALRKHLWVATPFAMKGCIDDILGMAHAFPTAATLGDGGEFSVSTTGGKDDYDYCPGKSGIQDDVFSLDYSVKKLQTR